MSTPFRKATYLSSSITYQSYPSMAEEILTFIYKTIPCFSCTYKHSNIFESIYYLVIVKYCKEVNIFDRDVVANILLLY